MNGVLTEFLNNIHIQHHREQIEGHMSQAPYIEKFFESFDCLPDIRVATPMKASLVLSDEEETDLTADQEEFRDNFPHQSLLGCVLYDVNMFTRACIS